MPYVTRDDLGQIIAISDHQTTLEAEFLPNNHPDVMAYYRDQAPKDAQAELEKTDREMSRILEDLIDVLVKKNLINFTDLPLPAQRKLVGRQKLRRNLSALTNLVSDQDEIF